MFQKFSGKILIILALITVCVAGYFTFVKPSGLAARRQSSPVPPTAEIPSYTNVALGYSMQYPKGWVAETKSVGNTVTNTANPDQVISIRVSEDNPGRLSLNDWLRTQQWPGTVSVEKQFKSIDAIGDVDAVQQSPTGTVYFTKGTTVVMVENGEGFERMVVDEKLFLQMLSSFTFTK